MIPVTPHLLIHDMHIQHLRCHEEMVWKVSSGLNLISGDNGCGKTSLLESVYVMAHGRSFRQARDPELVAWGAKLFHISARWSRYGPLHVKASGQRGKVEINLQGRKIVGRKELSETLPVVVEAPQAGKLIDGVPNERRRWLDGLLIACDPALQKPFHYYLRALMQRSRLLRHSVSSQELVVWEQQIVMYGQELMKVRSRLIASLNQYLMDDTQLTESALSLNINNSAPLDQDIWLSSLAENRMKDAKLGRLTTGPHCDRLRIEFKGKEIRSVGSRGQQKLAAMALRLAECAVRLQHRHVAPVLLLDDCLEALDTIRQQRLLLRLGLYPGQVLMTAPNSVLVPKGLKLTQYELKNGKIVNGESVCTFESHQKMEKAA